MTIPFTLDQIIEKSVQPRMTDPQRTLKALAGVSLNAEEARAVLPLIREHKWFVSERLGRDVGWRVAAIDFFEHVHEARAARRASDLRAGALTRLARRAAELFLAHQSWKAHDGVFARVA